MYVCLYVCMYVCLYVCMWVCDASHCYSNSSSHHSNSFGSVQRIAHQEPRILSHPIRPGRQRRRKAGSKGSRPKLYRWSWAGFLFTIYFTRICFHCRVFSPLFQCLLTSLYLLSWFAYASEINRRPSTPAAQERNISRCVHYKCFSSNTALLYRRLLHYGARPSVVMKEASKQCIRQRKRKNTLTSQGYSSLSFVPSLDDICGTLAT